MTFDDIFDRLIGHEGAYSNDPNDPGGETNWGITWPVLREAISLGIVEPTLIIKTLKRDDVRPIYKALFWDLVDGDRLIASRDYDGLGWQLFDFAVNSGIGTAIRYLQRALGVADDGRFGPVSRAALEATSESDVIMLLNAERLDFMTRLKNWKFHGKGWARRIAQNLRYGAEDSD